MRLARNTSILLATLLLSIALLGLVIADDEHNEGENQKISREHLEKIIQETQEQHKEDGAHKEEHHASTATPAESVNPAHALDHHHNEDKKGDNGTAAVPPKIYFEVIKIKEQLVVDEHNRPKSYSADMKNGLFTMAAGGRLKRLFWAEMHLQPKRQSALQALHNDPSTAPPSLQDPEGDGPNLPQWLIKMAEFLHLEKFWPRLLVSIILGFIFTALLFLLGRLLLYLIYLITGYSPLGEEGDEHNRNDSSAELFDKSQQPMDESKTLNSRV